VAAAILPFSAPEFLDNGPIQREAYVPALLDVVVTLAVGIHALDIHPVFTQALGFAWFR
jgi:hypothetical protein